MVLIVDTVYIAKMTYAKSCHRSSLDNRVNIRRIPRANEGLLGLACFVATRRRYALLTTLIAGLLCFGQALGATFYVATTGDDAKSGAQDQPWLTIQKAANTMQAGDTTIVQSGSYPEVAHTVRSGTAGAYITFRGSGLPEAQGFRLSHSYIRIEGFKLNGQTVPGYNGVISLLNAAHYAQIVGNTIQNTPTKVYGIWWNNSASDPSGNVLVDNNRIISTLYPMINVNGSGQTISNNYFEEPTGADAIRCSASNTAFVGNEFNNISNPGVGNHTDIIQTFSTGGLKSLNVIFERNYIHDCKACQIGMMEDQEKLGNIGFWTFRNNIYSNVDSPIHIYAHDVSWYNNIFYRSGTTTAGPVLFRYSTTKGSGNNGKCFNNIFIECGAYGSSSNYGWYSIDAGVTGFSGDYNMVAGPNGAPKTASKFTEAHGINGGSVNFMSLATNDFRLQKASPCAGKGVNLYTVFTTDKDGATRQSAGAWDIGPYLEKIVPSAPSRLRVVR